MTGFDAESTGRRLAIHLRKNNFAICHIILDTIEQELIARKKVAPREAIAELPLPLRLVNKLEDLGFLYIKDLADVNFEEMKKEVKYMGDGNIELLTRVVGEALTAIEEERVMVEGP
ncbi:hypothetical protein LCGC14_0429080 [marine sediment metagenome]|uniref:Uncharacterized protein n=1 Tax=marine sediment metagenome TaxID=412755 RepID=A0A0F9SNN4_9ZZZZ